MGLGLDELSLEDTEGDLEIEGDLEADRDLGDNEGDLGLEADRDLGTEGDLEEDLGLSCGPAFMGETFFIGFGFVCSNTYSKGSSILFYG